MVWMFGKGHVYKVPTYHIYYITSYWHIPKPLLLILTCLVYSFPEKLKQDQHKVIRLGKLVRSLFDDFDLLINLPTFVVLCNISFGLVLLRFVVSFRCDFPLDLNFIHAKRLIPSFGSYHQAACHFDDKFFSCLCASFFSCRCIGVGGGGTWTVVYCCEEEGWLLVAET